MQFQSVYQIHQTARDLAQLQGHSKIGELLFHANQN